MIRKPNVNSNSRTPWRYNTVNSVIFDKIVKAGREAGLDDYAISGMIGNFVLESGLNFMNTKHKGYNGIGQIMNSNWNIMTNYYGGNSIDHLIKYYIDHALGRIPKKYSGTIGHRQGGMTRKFTNAVDAADAWMKTFEKPVITDKTGRIIGYQEQDKRRAYANDVYLYLQSQRSKQPEVNMPTVEQVVEQAPAKQYNINLPVLKAIQTDPILFLNSIDVPYETPSPVHMRNSLLPDIRTLLEQQIFQPKFLTR